MEDEFLCSATGQIWPSSSCCDFAENPMPRGGRIIFSLLWICSSSDHPLTLLESDELTVLDSTLPHQCQHTTGARTSTPVDPLSIQTSRLNSSPRQWFQQIITVIPTCQPLSWSAAIHPRRRPRRVSRTSPKIVGRGIQPLLCEFPLPLSLPPP